MLPRKLGRLRVEGAASQKTKGALLREAGQLVRLERYHSKSALKVERQGRLLRWALGGWALSASVLLMGAGKATPTPGGEASAQVLKVRRLAVVDEEGTERLVLEGDQAQVWASGKTTKRTGLFLLNPEGKEVGGMFMAENGISAVMLDSRTSHGNYERVGFFVGPDGSSGFRVDDPKGKSRAILMVDEKMNTIFKLLDGEERPKMDVRIQPDGKIESSGVEAQGQRPVGTPDTPRPRAQ